MVISGLGLPWRFSRPLAAGVKRGALDHETSSADVAQGTSAEPGASATTCLICDKLIREDEATVSVHIGRSASDPRPARGPAHSHCFRAEIFTSRNW
jgi:hypothetical protein